MHQQYILVGSEGETFVERVAEILCKRSLPPRRLDPATLSDVAVTIRDGHFWVEKERVAAVLFRSPPDGSFSGNFAPQDQGFADAETRALWLAALNLASVRVTNRCEASAWFGKEYWSSWRRRLLQSDIALAPLMIGNQPLENSEGWLLPEAGHLLHPPPAKLQRLFGSALTTTVAVESYLVVYGEIFADKVPACIWRAGELLARMGIDIVELSINDAGELIGLDTFPTIPSEHLDTATDLLLERTYGHLHLW